MMQRFLVFLFMQMNGLLILAGLCMLGMAIYVVS
jgi:hypothetical protein